METKFVNRRARKRFLVPLLLVIVTVVGGGLPPPVAGALVEGIVSALSSPTSKE